MTRDDATVLDMLRAAQLAVEFTRGLEQSAFHGDLKTQSAVLHHLLVLGEAVKRLSASFRTQYPAIPWRRIAGMRDRIIHGYDEVDPDAVWQVVHTNVPQLLLFLESLAASESEQ